MPRETPARVADPVLSYAETAYELGISLATLKRRVLPRIPIVQLSPRRRGIRASVVEGLKNEMTIAPRNGGVR
jgi:hypothetical protein